MFYYCLTHLVLKRSRCFFKWPIDKNNAPLERKKWEGDIWLRIYTNVYSFGWLPYKPTTCTMKMKPPSQWEFSRTTFIWLVKTEHGIVGYVLVTPTPTRFTYSLYSRFCYTSHHQTPMCVCMYLVNQENSFILFFYASRHQTLCVFVYLVYPENSFILFCCTSHHQILCVFCVHLVYPLLVQHQNYLTMISLVDDVQEEDSS